MSETIKLNKQLYVKPQFERVIDTTFTQLVQPQPVSPTTIPAVTVAEFFQNYQEIFFQIPKFGTTNSHEYLIQTSQGYIGGNQSDDGTIQALIDEITQLRQENLDLRQQLLTGSISI
jgi:hypothetical protein